MTRGEIKKIASKLGVRIQGTKKVDAIRAIQIVENNFDCYGTSRVGICGEDACLWRNDCQKENENGSRDT